MAATQPWASNPARNDPVVIQRLRMHRLRTLFQKLTCLGNDVRTDVAFESPLEMKPEPEPEPGAGDEGAVELCIPASRELHAKMVPNLPVELFHVILSFSSSHELCQIAKANRLCSAIATRLLYREIDLHNPVKTVQCIRTLALSQAAAVPLFVRNFHVSDSTTGITTSTTAGGADVLPAFYKLLHKALLRMHNLEELSLLIGGPRSSILTGCSFRLKTFATACHWDKPLVKWLEGQDELVSAMFCGKYHHGCILSQESVPRLKRISASPLILAAIVPGRPVEEAELCLGHPWLMTSDIISTTLRILAYSSSSINTLQFIAHLTHEPHIALRALRTVPEHLPGLSSLAIHIVKGSVTEDVLDGLSPILSSFTSLRSVIILSKNNDDALHNETMTFPLVKLWHQSCTSLEIVSFPGSIWVKNPRLGWVTLSELERIFAETAQELQKKEKELSQREQEFKERQDLLHQIVLARRVRN